MGAAVRTGLDRLVASGFAELEGQRVGLITNQTGVTADLRDNISLLAAAPNVTLATLFAPEHGILGVEQAGERVKDGRERRTGAPVVSLYGERRAPSEAQLSNIDTLVFDIQTVGVRYYTYLSTLRLALHAAARSHRSMVLLDRPNPLGGIRVEGFPSFEETCRSFVCCAPVPIRHGLTIGEIARWLVATESLDVDLRIVAMEGWRREMDFDGTGLPWIAPSPNMPTVTTATVYPGTCLLEGTNVSEGRGTTRPFELFGAPWLDAFRLADRLNGRGLPGVYFRPTSFVPTCSKHAGERCEGVQVHVTDRGAFRPVRTGLEILAALRPGWPEFRFTGARPFVDRLLGTSAVREALDQGADPAELCASWEYRERAFQEECRAFLLYE